MANYSDYSNVASATTWSAGEALIRGGNTIAWYDSQDLSTITKDGSNFVSVWADKLASGINLAQATGGQQPVWSANGITYDGAAQWMQVLHASFTAPLIHYIVAKQISWTLDDIFIDGNNTNKCKIQQSTSSPKLIAQRVGGTATAAINGPTIGQLGIFRLLIANPTGSFQINNNTAEALDDGLPNDPLGVTHCRYGGTASRYGNFLIAEHVIRNNADNATQQTNVYNYLASKWGLPTI